LAVVHSSKPMLTDTHGRRYALNATAAAVIGSRGCAILLSDPGVPAQAARLIPSGGGFLLEDISGTVQINGRGVSTPTALQAGDQVKIGAAILTYQGPATVSGSPKSPPAVVTAKPVKAAVVSAPSPPPPPPPLAPLSNPPGLALRNWGKDAPLVEGYVELVDGPHRVEKGNLGAKVATSLALSIISSSLAMIPFWTKQDVNVWFLRVKDQVRGNLVSVLMQGQPGSLPQLGDFIAVWGVVKDGNVLMKRGYSYTTNSDIRLKG
jgi:hypothetical protein